MRYHGATLSTPVDLAAILERGLSLYPDAPALTTAEETYSWRTLDRHADAYAKNLLAAGLSPGDRVATFLPNSGPLIIHYLATQRAGLVAVPLNFRYTSFEIDHALDVSGARALVFDGDRRADVTAATRTSDLALTYVFGGGALEKGERDVADLFAEPPAGDLPPVAPDTPAVIFFTSGSTGPAKGVTHTHRTLGWMFASGARVYQLAPDDVFFPASSCSHVGGFLNTFASFSEGASVVVPRMGDIHKLLEMLRTHRPTVTTLLPAALFELERQPDAVREDFASLRLVVSGGDKIPDQLEKEFIAKTGLPVDEIYGMTEIGLSHINPSSGLVNLGSIGRVAPGFMVDIRDDDGSPVPEGTPGRLWVKFPGTMVRYWNRPKETAEVYDADGWFDTGDLVKVEERGYFYFCGRKKQIIVHDGSNIFPQEVEDALLEHVAVQLAAVIGVNDLVHGENVRAYVALRDGATRPQAGDLIAFARERVGYKAPEDVIIMDTLPLNPTGKVDRVRLKREAAERINASGAGTPP